MPSGLFFIISPNPYYKQKERTNRFIAEMSSLFSVCEVFAAAKVKLRCSEVCAKLLCNFYAPSEVKFAPIFAVRRNFTIRRITSLTR